MKKGKHKIQLLYLFRLLIQIAFYILLPALFISTFSGIKQIYLSIINRNFSISTLWPQVVEVFAIIPATLLLGRFFCGWMCAFGTLGDIVYLVSRKIFKLKFKMNEKVDRVLKYIKYIVLAFAVIALWTLGNKSFSTSNPWDVFGIIATFGNAPDISYAISTLTPGFIIFAFIIGASLFAERFFCRYLCPLGAVFSIISKIRIAKIQKPGDKCGNCRICTQNCAMGIPLYKHNVISSGECINCFKCISACPRKNVSLTLADEDLRPVVAGAMAVTVMTGMYYAGSLVTNFAETNSNNSVAISQGVSSDSKGDSIIDNQSNSDSSSNSNSKSDGIINNNSNNNTSKSTASSNKKYKDGTYQGTGIGFRGARTTVSVTIKNDKITDVQVLSYGDTSRFFNRAYPVIVNETLNLQSAQVNAVSGATYSSNGIMSAVTDALSTAYVNS